MSSEVIDIDPEPAVDLDFTMGNGNNVHVTISGFTLGAEVLQVLEALGGTAVRQQILEQFARADGDLAPQKLTTYMEEKK